MNELTDKDVYHIAHLARIHIEGEEVSKYKSELDLLMKEIEKINEVKIDTKDYMISTTDNTNLYREDNGIDTEVDILSNAPKRNGNYIEIKRFVND